METDPTQKPFPPEELDTRHPILHIEDDSVSARVVMRALVRAGFEVEWAQDGAEGLAKLDYHDYAVVLLDYNMPKCSGMEVIRAIQERGISTPIVMLTGSGDEVVAVEAMKLGAADYMVKDAEGGYLTLLPAIVERAIRRHRLNEQKRLWDIERERLILELQTALAQVDQLGNLLPVCSSCKKIRDDDGCWQQVDEYLLKHRGTLVSHSICPNCYERLYGSLLD